MQKAFVLFLVAFTSFLFITFLFAYPVQSEDELDVLTKKIAELQKSLTDSQKATKPLESQMNNIRRQLDEIESRVIQIEKDVEKKRKDIDKGYKNLDAQKDQFNLAIRNHYIKQSLFSPLIIFVSSADAGDVTRLLMYQQKNAEADQAIITTIALTLTDLEQRKNELEQEEKKLAVVKGQLASENEKLATVVKGAKEYQATLSREIATISAKQQQLLAQKLGSLNLPTSLGAGPLFCTDDRKLDPGFSPAFAFFTYGIPHRIGMNQYGALGRAKAGQSYQDILRAYFDGISFEKRDSNMRIKVQGFGEMGLDEYMLGIYEMPASWPIEAQKAQAIAARSYALSYTNNGEKEICTTQACQVYKGGNKGGDWERAVRDTAGEVITHSGQVVTAWYASTAGGYLFKSSDVGWSDRPWTKRMRDTTGDATSFSELTEKAYDKESPCFYAAQGFRSEYGKSAWLKVGEVADIVNVLLLAKQDSGTQTHLSQPDKPNPDGAETWSPDRVKQELKSRGVTPFDSISEASIGWDSGLGKTNSITFSGNAGSTTFNGDEFKQYFNLRAPANIQIVGPLYNIERK